MTETNRRNEKALNLFRMLRIGSPVLMFAIAGLCYVMASDDMKVILAGLFLFLAVMEYAVFSFLIKQIESRR